jgi:shikimate dehydrogenase
MRHYCVIGYPISHSLSPKIHNKWFKKFRISAQYRAISVNPADLAEFMRSFRAKFSGANVTIPHKEKIIKFLDAVSPEARKIGAVNTIVNRGGKLVGYNTDVEGAMEALRGNGKCKMEDGKCACKMSNGKEFFQGEKVVVLGAGGAARAIVYGLKKAGGKVVILNRTLSHAKKLAKKFGCKFGRLKDFKKFAERGIDILINTTSVGMWPQVKKTPLPNFSQFLPLYRSTALLPFVMDIVYRPRMTKLLRDAKKAGCKIITGDKMLLAQAAKSFELFYFFKNSLPSTSGGGGASSGSSSP